MKNGLIWTLAISITLLAVYYQRTTGPTYPKKFYFNTENEKIKIKLIRSETSGTDARIALECIDTSYTAQIEYKLYPTNEPFIIVGMHRSGNILEGLLPSQPPAGKLAYNLILYKNGSEVFKTDNPVIIRFKGYVPAWVLWPHILFIFAAMFFSNYCGILAIWGNKQKLFFYSMLTIILLTAGGMILGPIVQYYAFGQAWTGIPFGMDLTDNKTLLGYLIWLAAVFANKNKIRPGWIIIAAFTLLLIYSIPHSLFGSELNYSTGQIVTGE